MEAGWAKHVLIFIWPEEKQAQNVCGLAVYLELVIQKLVAANQGLK